MWKLLLVKAMARKLCCTVLAIGLWSLLLIFSSPSLAISDTGFSGTVTGAGGAGVANVQIYIYDETGNLIEGFSATTAADGTYTFGGLSAGTYKVSFNNGGSQLWYNNKYTLLQSDTLTVTDGVVTPGINADFSGTWGVITGRVTDLSGAANLSGIQVRVCNTSGVPVSSIPAVTTKSDGSYAISLVPAGNYTVKFSDGTNGYVDQWYNTYNFAFSTYAYSNSYIKKVTVTAGVATPSINGQMSVPTISGKVTNLAGSGIAGINVYLFSGTDVNGFTITNVVTKSDGSYYVGGIPAGSYQVYFEDPNSVYTAQYYNNQASVTVTSPTTTVANINATLTSSTKPSISAFSVPTTSSSTTVSGITLAASGPNGVTGYLITESPTAPLYTASGWSATAPASYTASNSGIITLYPWAKDSTNLVSAVYGSPQTVTITLPANGTCGSANGGSFSVAPTANLCSAGTASSVTGTGPWSWTCAGTNGGTTANCSASVLVVDTTPPALTVSTLLDGATTNNPVLNVSGVVSDASGLKSLTVKGQTVDPALITASGFFSKAVVLNSGANTVAIVATDNANNATTITRTITYSSSAPLLTVDTPADVSTTNQSAITVSGTVDAAATSVTVNGVAATLGSGTYSASNIPLTAGGNTVDIVATTPNGTSTAKRTVIYNSSLPSLAVTAGVTNPAQTITQDFTTTKVNITINGTVSSDVTGVSISVSGPYITTQSYTPAVAGNAFTQTIALSSVQTYTIAVTATGTGTAAILRNIVFRPGDCNGDGKVTLGEARTAINQYFSPSSPPQCIDLDENGSVSLGEARKAINSYFGL